VLDSTPGNAKPIFRTVSKSMVLLGIGQRDSVELPVLILPAGAAVIISENRNTFKIGRVTR